MNIETAKERESGNILKKTAVNAAATRFDHMVSQANYTVTIGLQDWHTLRTEAAELLLARKELVQLQWRLRQVTPEAKAWEAFNEMRSQLETAEDKLETAEGDAEVLAQEHEDLELEHEELRDDLARVELEHESKFESVADALCEIIAELQS